MASQLSIRPTRKAPRKPIRWGLGDLATAASGTLGPGLEAPQLTLAEPENPQSRRVTGGLTFLGHVAVLTALVLAAALAPPELIEQVIPVALVPVPQRAVELPGSNLEPAPSGPKQVGARRANAAQLAASQILPPSEAAALRRDALEAARRAIEQLNLESAQAIPIPSLPTQVERSDLRAESVTAQETAPRSQLEPIVAREVETLRIDPGDLAVEPLTPEGPRQINAQALNDLALPDSLAALDALPDANYAGSEIDTALLAAGANAGAQPIEISIDTAMGGALGGGAEGSAGVPGWGGLGEGAGGGSGGAGGGGQGSASGVTRCLESAAVQRYLGGIQQRTRARWTVPREIPADTEVVLGFALDRSGTTRDVRGRPSDDATLSASARQALLAASPFPPLINANRCLAEKRLRLTFTVPAR